MLWDGAGNGMACVAIGASDIPVGAETASVSMIWHNGLLFSYDRRVVCFSSSIILCK